MKELFIVLNFDKFSKVGGGGGGGASAPPDPPVSTPMTFNLSTARYFPFKFSTEFFRIEGLMICTAYLQSVYYNYEYLRSVI